MTNDIARAIGASTDPDFVRRQLGVQRAQDGRRMRSERTKAAILAACRQMMLAGEFRPTMADICRRTPCALRTGFFHFNDVEALHREALQDGVVRDHIAMRAIGPGWEMLGSAMRDRIARCVVLGSTA